MQATLALMLLVLTPALCYCCCVKIFGFKAIDANRRTRVASRGGRHVAPSDAVMDTGHPRELATYQGSYMVLLAQLLAVMSLVVCATRVQLLWLGRR